MAELMLLLPAEQAGALEREAARQQQTVAQILRLLIGDFLAAADRAAADPCRTSMGG